MKANPDEETFIQNTDSTADLDMDFDTGKSRLVPATQSLARRPDPESDEC